MTKNNEVWFAMSVPVGKELETQILLQHCNIEAFLPMCQKITSDSNIPKNAPAIPNLIFVKSTQTIIKEIKRQIPILQHLTKPENGKDIPITVSEQTMLQFITIYNNPQNPTNYLSPAEIDISNGTQVRITEGVFNGIEGILLPTQDKSKKNLAIILPDIVAVVVSEINPNHIQIIE